MEDNKGEYMNSFSKVVAILIGAVMFFVLPVYQLAQKQDDISQIYVANETTKFVDSIRNSGYISVEMYQDYVNKIDKTGNIYNIQICHSHKIVKPNYDDEAGTILNGYDSYFVNTYQDEVLDSFDKGEDYKFNEGDYINVTVSNRNKTMAANLLYTLTHASADVQVFVTYGGMIRDEID